MAGSFEPVHHIIKTHFSRNKYVKAILEPKIGKLVEYFSNIPSLIFISNPITTGITTTADVTAGEGNKSKLQRGRLSWRAPKKANEAIRKRNDSKIKHDLPIKVESDLESNFGSGAARTPALSGVIPGSAPKDNRVTSCTINIHACTHHLAPYPVANTHTLLFAKLLGLYPKPKETIRPVLGYIAAIVLVVSVCERFVLLYI